MEPGKNTLFQQIHLNWQPTGLKKIEVVLSNTYQTVTSACFSGARKKYKGVEENNRAGGGEMHILYLQRLQNVNVFYQSEN